MIQVAVALGIADSLHDGPKPATKLVTDSGADANMVLRLCRALSAFGIFEVDSEDMVSQSARSAWLRKDASSSGMCGVMLLLLGLRRHTRWGNGGPVPRRWGASLPKRGARRLRPYLTPSCLIARAESCAGS